MKKLIQKQTAGVLLVAGVFAGALLSGCCGSPAKASGDAAQNAFTVTSPDITDGKPMTVAQEFDGMGAHGKNLSPGLVWANAPAGTKSFALTVYDPDAPTGSGWWHYVLVDIPATTHALATGAGTDAKLLPAGAKQVRNDFGFRHFGGAAPPKGDKPHRYIFTVHALKAARLDIPDDASAALAGFMIHANELGEAKLTAFYAR